jgi:hypothetical protein
VVELSGSDGIHRLAPSYDHASSLGRELLDANRQVRLETKDPRQTVEHYILRARSGLYADATTARALHPIAAFRLASEQRPEAGEVWLDRLDALREDTLRSITQRIPGSVISEFSRRFAFVMLQTARRLILEGAGN